MNCPMKWRIGIPKLKGRTLASPSPINRPKLNHRCLSDHTRQRRENFWVPTVKIHHQDEAPDATQLLIRAGYLRQAYAGIFHMLPLGLRVQEKLERLIDKHMRSIGASKISLSSISSQKTWERSGRLTLGGELFTFKDRKDAKWLLAPTHEEEITMLMAQSSQDIPARLYQVSRKYRDEKRPRAGLLRGREFIMKDLYTFDRTVEEAHATYDEIRQAYRNFLDELKVDYVEARADSGNMGGKLSHEYHFPNRAGEDLVITCSACDYARNEEFVEMASGQKRELDFASLDSSPVQDGHGTLVVHDVLSKDGQSLVRALAPDQFSASGSNEINPYAVKAAMNGILELDTGIERPGWVFRKNIKDAGDNSNSKPFAIYYLLDDGISEDAAHSWIFQEYKWLHKNNLDAYIVSSSKESQDEIKLLKQKAGDTCPQCHQGKLKIDKAIEIGHTFHLGTRYSSKLDLNVSSPVETGGEGKTIPVQMGCHGVGISRLIAAVASTLSDSKGLNWPRIIAPFEVVIIMKTDDARQVAAEALYDELSNSSINEIDVLLDDRADKSLGWKMKDADIIGYPVTVIIGNSFEQQQVEVQCRRLNIKENVNIKDSATFIRGLLEQL